MTDEIEYNDSSNICEDCDGAGEINCEECGQSTDCTNCEGSGTIE